MVQEPLNVIEGLSAQNERLYHFAMPACVKLAHKTLKEDFILESKNINTKEPSVEPKFQLTETIGGMFGYLRSERRSYKRKCKASISHLCEFYRL